MPRTPTTGSRMAQVLGHRRVWLSPLRRFVSNFGVPTPLSGGLRQVTCGWMLALYKLMDTTHIRRVLQQGRWSIEFAPGYVKQTSKKAKAGEAAEDLPGRAVGENDRGLLEFVFRHSEEPGWHFVDGIGINVSRGAKSMRSPQPQLAVKDFPLRTSMGEFLKPDGRCEWRLLEDSQDMLELPNPNEQMAVRARKLVTFFVTRPKATIK